MSFKVESEHEQEITDGKCPRLENWWCRGVGHSAHGDVYDHPKFSDGAFVHTSIVRYLGPGYLVTMNTTYVLGRRV